MAFFIEKNQHNKIEKIIPFSEVVGIETENGKLRIHTAHQCVFFVHDDLGTQLMKYINWKQNQNINIEENKK